MGMYDTVNCEAPLPGERQPPETNDFQTKDFDCWGERYTITADGQLLKDGTPVPLAYNCSLNFYTYTADKWWFEYEAEFVAGRLTAPIRLLEISQQLGAERIFHYPVGGRKR